MVISSSIVDFPSPTTLAFLLQVTAIHLLFITKNLYSFPGTNFSIKSVLPALFPNDESLNYKSLKQIHKGDEASNAYLELKNMNEDDLVYNDITPDKKIQNFKDNFSKFVELTLDRKDINIFSKESEGLFVVKGMSDWFDYVIHILESLYLIGPEDIKKYMQNFTEFI